MMKQETIIFWLGLIVFSFISAICAVAFTKYAFFAGAVMGLVYKGVWDLSRYVQYKGESK